MPLIKSSTGTCIFGSMNMREPGIFQARSDTGRACCRLSFLARRASNTRYAVINLVREAGSTAMSASLAASTWLAVTSISSQDLAAISGGWGIWACATRESARNSAPARTWKKRFIRAWEKSGLNRCKQVPHHQRFEQWQLSVKEVLHAGNDRNRQ